MKRRIEKSVALALLCVAFLVFVTGCGKTDKVDISTSRGDPAPLEVTLTYLEEFKAIGDESDGEKRLILVKAIFTNIKSFEYVAGGPLWLVGDEAEKHIGGGGMLYKDRKKTVGVTRIIDDPDLIKSVEIYGAVGANKQEARPRSNGLYEAPLDSESTFFLYFFDDWKVRVVLSSGSASDVAKWIAKTESSAYEGKYGVSGSLVRFAFYANDGSVRYEGQLTEQGLSTVSSGYLPREFRFHEIEINR